MSHRVVPMLAEMPEATQPARILHFVPPGYDTCPMCKGSKFQQGFFYTDEPNLWAVLCHHEPDDRVGMWVPAYEMAVPFAVCRAPKLKPVPDCGEAGHDTGKCGNAACTKGTAGGNGTPY